MKHTHTHTRIKKQKQSQDIGDHVPQERQIPQIWSRYVIKQ